MSLQNFSFVCLDFETTGLEESAEIIEIGMVKVVDGEIVDRYEQLVQPHRPIPEHITLLTGISDEMVADKPYWSEVQQTLLDFIGDHLLVAHNINFDRNMLENHLGYETQNLWVDTHDLAKIFLPNLTSYKLVGIAAALDIHEDDFHRADTDAIVCAKVLLKTLEIALATDPFTLQKIYDVFAEQQGGLTHVLRRLTTTVIAKASIGTDYTKKSTESLAYGDAPILTFAQSQCFFEPDGPLAQQSEAFHYRPQQLGMNKTIISAFTEKKHGIIEAGTGTGKSFAYLVPSLLWAHENNCRVIVSTNTIALQEQLFHSDVPFLKQVLNYDFPVALSKGRSNYLCVRRHELYKNQLQNMLWSEKIFFAGLLYWLSQTIDGDKESLNLNKMEHQFWSNVSSQTETCLGNKCPYFRRCYFMQNKKACENASLIITNHALLLQDIKLGGQVLPGYDHVIIDEAHNLEDETTKQFTESMDLEFLRKSAKQLIRNNSLLNRIVQKLNHLPGAGDIPLLVQDNIKQLEDDIHVLDGYITTAADYPHTIGALAHGNERRVTANERASKWWPEFEHNITQIGLLTITIDRRLTRIHNELELVDGIEDLFRELVFTQSWFKGQAALAEDFVKGDNPSSVYWFNYINNTWGNNLILSIAPIDAMPILKEFLFDANDSVVLTSATLAVSKTLKYAAETYLLQENDYLSYITPSPFDYQQQSLIAIPNDNPDYTITGEKAYSDMVISNLEKLILAVTGGMLVLFTSYTMLNKVYFALKRNPALSQYNILAHGQDGSRTSIIQSLNHSDHTVVLGASSFWEGIDVKGIGLTTVVIVKLPFLPPTRAVTSAKLEHLAQQGKNSFSHYSLPQAVLKFRQGCGRLIRTNTDWGAIVILDNRIISKSYGREFLNSLPQQPVIRDSLDNVCRHLQLWMQEKSL